MQELSFGSMLLRLALAMACGGATAAGEGLATRESIERMMGEIEW